MSSWKDRVNSGLQRATGHELRKVEPASSRRRRKIGRPPARGDRLVRRPTFVLSSIRSGSTLVRVLLNSHSQIHSPQELHFRYIDVQFTAKWARQSMAELGLDDRGLEYLLWDRILDRELTSSGKPNIVCKTPNDVFIADRIREAWPDSKFIFLLRHPAAIARSRKALRPNADDEKNFKLIAKYCDAVEAARQTYEGLTIRYEDVTVDPAAETKRICAFLGLKWEPGMVDYGSQDHGRYRPGLGDWAGKIKTGQVQPAEPPPPPEEVHPLLRDAAVAWGYMTADAPAPASS